MVPLAPTVFASSRPHGQQSMGLARTTLRFVDAGREEKAVALSTVTSLKRILGCRNFTPTVLLYARRPDLCKDHHNGRKIGLRVAQHYDTLFP